jgi:hypothetical protein
MKYSLELTEEICSLLKQGHNIKTACDAVNISQTTFYDWMADKPDFSESIKKAKAHAKRVFISTIAKAAAKSVEVECPGCHKKFDVSMPNDWKAAAWWAERNYPDEYALVQTHRVEGRMQHAHAHLIIDGKDISSITSVEDLRDAIRRKIAVLEGIERDLITGNAGSEDKPVDVSH